MSTSILASLSNELAERTTAGAQHVVQVAGARRPASGVVHGPDTVITTTGAIGREDGLRVKLPDQTSVDAELAGWDPSTGIALLKTRTALDRQPPQIAQRETRSGEFVLALARSWSNAITAATGIVAVVGGPLRTGRRRQIEQVIRVTAPMHEGFAGGAVLDDAGGLIGIATASEIRGFGVVIPASIAWAAADQLLTSGTPRRGFIGVAIQPVTLPPAQRPDGRQHALLVVGVTASSPAERAGVQVGDLLLELEGKAVNSADDLMDALSGRAIGQTLSARALRGGTIRDLSLTVGERPSE